MKNSKKQIASDKAMVKVLEANAVRVFDNHKTNAQTGCDQCLLDTEPASCECKCHVDAQGFVTFKNDG